MAVSILEASAARVVAQYVPVSRLRPLRELVEQVGETFCRDQSVVPLYRDGGGVLVATSRPRAQDMLRELRERLGQTITTRLASPGEIRIAIDNALEVPDSIHRREALADLLQEMQL